MDKSQFLKSREYEMLTILLPDQGEEETKTAIDKMLSYITDENGTITSVNFDSPWGRRRLAYTVRHDGVDYRDGHYVLTYFNAMPSALSDIERELKLDTSVIRYLILIHDPEMGEKIDENALAEERAAAEAAAAEQASSEAATPAEEVTEAAAPAEEVAEEAAPVEEAAEEAAPAEEAAEEAAPAEEVAEEAAPAEEAAEEVASAEEAAEEAAPAEEVAEEAAPADESDKE